MKICHMDGRWKTADTSDLNFMTTLNSKLEVPLSLGKLQELERKLEKTPSGVG